MMIYFVLTSTNPTNQKKGDRFLGIFKSSKHNGQGESGILTKAALSHVFDVLIGFIMYSGASNIQMLQLSGFCGRGYFKFIIN